MYNYPNICHDGYTMVNCRYPLYVMPEDLWYYTATFNGCDHQTSIGCDLRVLGSSILFKTIVLPLPLDVLSIRLCFLQTSLHIQYDGAVAPC